MPRNPQTSFLYQPIEWWSLGQKWKFKKFHFVNACIPIMGPLKFISIFRGFALRSFDSFDLDQYVDFC
jgi:hypothetical protein